MNEPWTYNGNKANIQLPDIVTTHDEIVKLCKEIKIHKASSITGLSSRILKDVFLSHTDKLKYIFDQILELCIFPTEWKCATIIPLKKGNNTRSVTDLRPISLLPLPSKLFEKIVHNRIINHLERNGLLDNNQGGFRNSLRDWSLIMGRVGYKMGKLQVHNLLCLPPHPPPPIPHLQDVVTRGSGRGPL